MMNPKQTIRKTPNALRYARARAHAYPARQSGCNSACLLSMDVDVLQALQCYAKATSWW